ncbi:hypothetical protein OXV71_17530 [Bacteroides fragilis]|nr:hypothetical protein [Bacteroides fragilis]
MGNLIYIRILQHDTEDQIRIGNSYPINDLDKAEENIVALYEKDTAWCGGFEAACKQYYKHIAIIDAGTLEVIRSIYGKKKEYVFIIENSQREVIGTITIQAESLPSHITIVNRCVKSSRWQPPISFRVTITYCKIHVR